MKIKIFCLVSFISIFIGACQSGAVNSTNTNNNQFTPIPLVWENCNKVKYAGISEQIITYFGPRLQCSMMTVPIDYNNLSLGFLSIAISRVKATDAQNRIGAILMNPGGPGGKGLGFAPAYAKMFDMTDINITKGEKLHKLIEVYDYIGFDPRGVGSSTNLSCQLDNFYKLELLATQDRSQTNFNNIYYNQEQDAKACQKNILTAFINSDATARDMDGLRQLLGDEKLNYYGYSYGTWLGIWYASLFPEHVNHMVLDSSINFNTTLVENNQAVPMQSIFDNMIIPYAALHPELFNLGESVGEIQNIFFTLDIKLQTALSNQLYLYLFNQKTADNAIEYLMAAKAINKIVTINPNISEVQLLLTLESYSFTSDAEINVSTVNLAKQLGTAYMHLVSESPVPVILAQNSNGNDAVNKSVTCNDGTNVSTLQSYWDGIIEQIYLIAPAYFHDRYEQNCTSAWNGPTVNKPDTAMASKINNILMVQNQYDAATNLQGALATFNMLGNASLILNTNSYTHGVFPTGKSCVDNTVADYLLNPTSNKHSMTVCEGQGLLPKNIRFGTSGSNSIITKLSDRIIEQSRQPMNENYIPDAYPDPELANQLINDIHEQIH
ncbi:MAG: alpha/beta hydrolase [Burkholderiales bacterium]|nr:alpha/beta hydrolase [Burkholderiales bacterium]